MIQNENFITIQGWMVNELNLKGNELLIYAIIYGFSQDSESYFEGNRKYLANWINNTTRTVQNCLNSLVEKNLIIKEEINKNGIKLCKYKISQLVKNLHMGSEKSSLGVVKNLHWGSEKFSQNNINNNISNNIDNSIDNRISSNIDEFIENYHKYANKFSKLHKLTDKRKKQIKARLKETKMEEWIEVFKKINESDFCNGKNDRKWKADIDWLIKNSDNHIKVLEGKYDNRNYGPYEEVDKKDFNKDKSIYKKEELDYNPFRRF